MEDLLTTKTASITEFRDPGKVIANAGGQPVAVLNRNRVVGYFVPIEAVEKFHFEPAADADIESALEQRKPTTTPVLKYLEDK